MSKYNYGTSRLHNEVTVSTGFTHRGPDSPHDVTYTCTYTISPFRNDVGAYQLEPQDANDRTLSLHIPYPIPNPDYAMINRRRVQVPTALLNFSMGMGSDNVLSLMALLEPVQTKVCVVFYVCSKTTNAIP